jgi:hypothetical protein
VDAALAAVSNYQDTILMALVCLLAAWGVRAGYITPISFVGAVLLLIGSIVVKLAPSGESAWLAFALFLGGAGLVCGLIGFGSKLARNFRRMRE